MKKHRDLIVIVLAALAVRLVWNLWVHPPLAYAYSDMGGYLERAQTSIDRPDEHLPYFTLFPWGTHWLLSLIKRAFGPNNGVAIGAVYALIGAGSVGFAFATAKRLLRQRWIARAIGAVLVVYYPWIALGGYTLSEPPFTLFLSATIFFALAYADRGRPRDALLLGASLALSAIFRPQILAALPLYAAHWLFRRRAWHRFSPKVIVPAIAVPLALIAVVSAARMQFHTGKYGLISSNGPLNYAFGRCHATTITSTAPDRKGIYSPPSLLGLAAFGKAHPGQPFQLDPAVGEKVNIEGHMWDAAPMYALASRCTSTTGAGRQVEFAIEHVALLWFFNNVWPDAGQAKFRPFMDASLALHNTLVLPAALLVAGLALRKRNARLMLLALHVYALMAVAMIYFGDTRLRVPYDGVLITLAAAGYACGWNVIRRRRAAAATRLPR